MGKDALDQPFSQLDPALFHRIKISTAHAPSEIPMLITKKWLCVRFDLVYPNGRVNVRGLYTKVLTKKVIQEMGMSEKEMRSPCLRTFDRQQTVLLIRLLGL